MTARAQGTWIAAIAAAALMTAAATAPAQTATAPAPSGRTPPATEAAPAGGDDPLQEARSLVSAGNTQAALRALDDIVAGDAAANVKVQARYYKGMVLLGIGEEDTAAGQFQALIQDYPGLPEPYNNLAAIYASKGELRRARDLLEQLVAQQPDYAVGYENLGDLYAKLAADAYSRAQELAQEPGRLSQKLELVNRLFRPPQ